MNTGKSIFPQTMEHLPLPAFRRCVQRYGGNYKAKTFSCLDQFLVMAFVQLSYRESLRDIEACLQAILYQKTTSFSCDTCKLSTGI
jgi:hypothetical protein